MLSEIQSGSHLAPRPVQKAQVTGQDGVPAGRGHPLPAPGAEAGAQARAFTAQVNMMFSSEIFTLLSSFQSEAGGGGALHEFAPGDRDFVSDLEHEIGDVFDFAEDLDLSPAEMKAVEQAENKFFQTLDRIEQQAGGKPLTGAQIEEIEKAADAFFEAVDPIMGDFDLTPEEQKKLAGAEEAFEKAVDAIFAEAAGKPLTADQEKRLAAAEQVFDTALEGIFGPPLTEAQESRFDQAFDNFDTLLDAGLAKLGTKDLSPGQDRTLDHLINRFEDQMAGLFTKPGPVSTENEKTIAAALSQFETALGKLVGRAIA